MADVSEVYIESTSLDGHGHHAGIQWPTFRSAVDAILTHPDADHENPDFASIVEEAHEQEERELRAEQQAAASAPPRVPTPPEPVVLQSQPGPSEYKRIIATSSIYGAPASSGAKGAPIAHVPGRIEPLSRVRWNKESILNLQSGFEDSIHRINNYVDVWNRGTFAEEAFDSLSGIPSVVTEDLVVTTDMINRTRISKLGPDMESVSMKVWKQVIMRKSDRGHALLRWIDMLIEQYQFMPGLKLVDYTELYSEWEQKQAELQGSDIISMVHAHRVAGRAHPKRAATAEDAQRIAFEKMVEITKGPIPVAHLVVHHTLKAALYRYQLCSSVHMTLSNAHVLLEMEARAQERTWGQYMRELFLGDQTEIEQYTYYRSKDELLPEPILNPHHQMQHPNHLKWREQITSGATIMTCKRHYESMFVVLEDGSKDRYRVMKLPADAESATACAQVLLHVFIPSWDRSDNWSSLEASYVQVPDDHEELRSYGSLGKQTPFNCDDPMCVGVRAQSKRCVCIPLRSTEWVDHKKQVKVDVRTSVAHTLSIPFIWGKSSVHATVQVNVQDVPQRSIGLSRVNRTANDRATYAYFTNVRFMCDMDTLRLAVSELLLYKSMHDLNSDNAERYRSASEFVRRGK